jgi:hypothetical protein
MNTRREWRYWFVALVFVLDVASGVLGKGLEVRHEPKQPKSGQSVLVTVKNKDASALDGLILQYQIVDPGKYIARKDAQFEKNWVAAPMNDAGEKGDRKAGDGIWTAELPGSLQIHRRLIRYRIVNEKNSKRIAPEPDDAQPNFAYFCYDGVPDWKGAINPASSDPKLREVVTFPSESLQKVPVYHFISHKASIENVTWRRPKPFGEREGRNDYDYTGTMVYDGVVYDHVEFRARGGEWRHAMGKNMWKFNFLPGHRLEAGDNYGRTYDTKWDKLNLGACIQQGDTGLRGEQGMLEAVGFRLFNMAGVEAPNTHWVHFRIIDGAEESPRDQYSGDFWGLYLAMENLDGHFLKEHKLPKGNLYKMEFYSPKTEFIGNPAITNQADVLKFWKQLGPQQPDAWWKETVDLPRYYSYRSILECIHHYDIQSGKNYFLYFNPASQKWVVLPWDIDLSWSDSVYGSGYEPYYQLGLVRKPPFRQQYQERLAEIRDLLFNQEQLGMLIDEYAAVIGGPPGKPSIAAADRAKWDYHPALAAGHPNKAGHGRFYFGEATNSFSIMPDYMKAYAARRMRWVDTSLLAGYQSPPAPKIAAEGPLDFSQAAVKFRVEANVGNANENPCVWRLAEVSDPKTVNPREPRKYEIDSLWEKELPAAGVAELPVKLLKPGHTYRLRARQKDASGRWSRWSSPVQFTVAAK